MAWWWAGLVEAGMTLGCLLAPLGQTETQACTQVQNRICVCEPGWYCTLKRQEGCRQCVRHRKCPPGFGVVKPGMAPGPVGLGDPFGSLLYGHQLISPAWERCQWQPGASCPFVHMFPLILSSSVPVASTVGWALGIQRWI